MKSGFDNFLDFIMEKLITLCFIIAIVLLAIIIGTSFVSCKTIDVEKNRSNEYESTIEKEKTTDNSFVKKLETEEDEDISDEEVYIAEVMKVNDVASAVVYVEPPETIYCEPAKESANLTGDAALKQNLKDITVLPEYTEGRLKGWSYKEGQIYQVHTQTL